MYQNKRHNMAHYYCNVKYFLLFRLYGGREKFCGSVLLFANSGTILYKECSSTIFSMIQLSNTVLPKSIFVQPLRTLCLMDFLKTMITSSSSQVLIPVAICLKSCIILLMNIPPMFFMLCRAVKLSVCCETKTRRRSRCLL